MSDPPAVTEHEVVEWADRMEDVLLGLVTPETSFVLVAAALGVILVRMFVSCSDSADEARSLFERWAEGTKRALNKAIEFEERFADCGDER